MGGKSLTIVRRVTKAVRSNRITAAGTFYTCIRAILHHLAVALNDGAWTESMLVAWRAICRHCYATKCTLESTSALFRRGKQVGNGYGNDPV